jgi:hypothetical protein
LDYSIVDKVRMSNFGLSAAFKRVRRRREAFCNEEEKRRLGRAPPYDMAPSKKTQKKASFSHFLYFFLAGVEIQAGLLYIYNRIRWL